MKTRERFVVDMVMMMMNRDQTNVMAKHWARKIEYWE